ncbi:MAG: FMN-binding glutamate synthase family protein [Hyphomicrobium aestuarii]|nr:FMN-binding glutamate synthase family protein [Hyphomicrobium aestuarii]
MHWLIWPFERRMLPLTLSFFMAVAGGLWLALPYLDLPMMRTGLEIFFHQLGWIPFVLGTLLTIVGIRDLTQDRHSILRNYPILAHMRFIFEKIRPEMRQYFFEGEKDGTPFPRDKRAIVYQRAKKALDKRPFGTQLDVYGNTYEWLSHSMAPTPAATEPFRITIGGPACKQPYSASVFNISAMSFGSLSKNAIRSLNKGAKIGGFAHDTGEGGISPYHEENGGDLIWEIGSGYFGARTLDGGFSAEKFAENAVKPHVKMIEIKLSQGAKPGHGGVLPAVKVNGEIARIRGVAKGRDCVSPAGHSAFSTPIEMMHFIAQLRELSGGKPVGFKLCIGQPHEFLAVVKAMLETGIRPDFIVVDGKEGGTGAAPLEFLDHIGMPLREGLSFVHSALVGAGIRDEIKIGCAGKIVSGFDMARVMALGADWCNAARGFMFAVGCIQAQTCHTDKCPTGVATQDPTRGRAVDVNDKSQRVASFHRETVKALAEIVAACGLRHPGQMTGHFITRRVSAERTACLAELYPVLAKGELLTGTTDPRFRDARMMEAWAIARADSFTPATTLCQAAGYGRVAAIAAE